MEKKLLDYFKVMLVNKKPKEGFINFDYMTKAILLNFEPNKKQVDAINEYIRDANVQTLFSVEEVNNLSMDDLIAKQICHYFLQFGTNYTLDVVRKNDTKATAVPVTFIRGVTIKELQKLVDNILYSNKPAKDTQVLVEIIKHYDLKFDITTIQNNELRVLLFDMDTDLFINGDDVVRYIVNKTTDSDLLIKNHKVITQVQVNAAKISKKFLENHVALLSQVFNRHKRIIMALKVGNNKTFKTIINQIARLSKVNHKPVHMPMQKTFIADVFGKLATKYDYKNLDNFTLRDKMKILNLLDFKLNGFSSDIFMIRNGKTHLEENRPVYNKKKLNDTIGKILASIKKDLKHLKGKTILLPEDMDYGLPVSRKQSVGNLPFGTKIKITTDEISSGVYWKNDWGAYDIDLSAVDEKGQRTGWGRGYGYDGGKTTGVKFSGDIVGAPNGAMEFLTSKKETYGLYANIFNGKIGSKIQVVVGEKSKKNDQWIDNAVIREEVELKSRGNVVGLVNGKEFTVFYGRMNDGRISGGKKDEIMVQKAFAMNWTVKKLFDELGIKYVTSTTDKPDYDLSYAGFTYDKLEDLFVA